MPASKKTQAKQTAERKAQEFLRSVRSEVLTQKERDRLAILAAEQYDAAAYCARIAVGDKARKVLNRVIKANKDGQLFGNQLDRKRLQEIVGEALTNYRADLTMRNLLATAYNAGRYEQQMGDRTRQFLYYRTMRDSHVRPSHRVLDGILRPKSDPIWKEIYPPNGHACRCRVDAVKKSELKALKDSGEPINTSPKLRRIKTLDKVTGEVEKVLEGIDPGWQHKPNDPRRLAQLVQRAIYILQKAPENVV